MSLRGNLLQKIIQKTRIFVKRTAQLNLPRFTAKLRIVVVFFTAVHLHLTYVRPQILQI